MPRLLLTALLLGLLAPITRAQPPVEVLPTDPALAKIVFIAGSNYYKPGEHEYIGGCAVMMDLVRQTPGTFPVLALDWPKKPETLKGAKAIVLLFDGGDKHGLLKEDRLQQIQQAVAGGAGLVQLHQVIDYPNDFGERARQLAGGVWEKGYSARAHWVAEFKTFPDHPICRGVTPFKIDDGWLTKLRFTADAKQITPLMRTSNPKDKAAPSADADIVTWAFEKPDGGRAFNFTGTHLHASFEQEGYRRLLTNGILWAAKLEIPKEGAKVELDAKKLPDYLAKPPAKK
jgi:type 1 glutamine amidotransferase